MPASECRLAPGGHPRWWHFADALHPASIPRGVHASPSSTTLCLQYWAGGLLLDVVRCSQWCAAEAYLLLRSLNDVPVLFPPSSPSTGSSPPLLSGVVLFLLVVLWDLWAGSQPSSVMSNSHRHDTVGLEPESFVDSASLVRQR